MRTFKLHADCYLLENKTKSISMINSLFLILFIISVTICSAQQQEISKLLADSSMAHASVSISIIDAATGDMIAGNDPDRSLTQASLMKLITTAASIELLGSDHTFKTVLAYSGTIKKSSGILDGDIIIKGGGDPALGSEYFPAHYGNFIEKWADEISRLGIKKIKGRVVSDDSYFDYQPAPSNWTWEDIGQYYGTGVYGVSAFDNTLKIHFKTGREGSVPLLTGIEPAGAVIEFRNYLKAWGSKDEGYVFTAPYGGSGWIAGSIPCQKEDFVLKA